MRVQRVHRDWWVLEENKVRRDKEFRGQRVPKVHKVRRAQEGRKEYKAWQGLQGQ